MVKHNQLIIVDYSQTSYLSLEELCQIGGISYEVVQHFISYDIVHPHGKSSDEWTFDLAQVERMRKALRLQRDFEMNMGGIALVLDLLDELKDLRDRLHILEK